jgi:putative hydrolase of the HAD superfamily
MNKTFIFDYDDTLAPNQIYYCHAQLDFMRYVLDTIGNRSPDVHSMINLQVDIDVKNVEKKGMSMDRFPTSFVETFKEICSMTGYPVSDRDLKDVYDIGTRAFDIKKGLEKGAEYTLDVLSSKYDDLILYTKGDMVVQEKKIVINDIDRWFKQENIHIVDKKDSSYLENFVNGRSRDKIFMVGNSIRSDINPALEAGIKAIYIPCETWAYERKHNGIDRLNPRIHVFEDLRGIIENYDNL